MAHKFAPTIGAFLVVDQASVSGVAVGQYVAGKLGRVFYGLAKKAMDRRNHLQQAIDLAGGIDRLVVVLEDHSKIPLSAGTKYDPKTRKKITVSRGTAQILGIGAARGRWEEQLEMAKHRDQLEFKTTPKEWREAILGRGAGMWKTDRAKQAAVASARLFLGAKEDPDHNAAEAVCMLQWAIETIPARMEAARRQAELFSRKDRLVPDLVVRHELAKRAAK